MRLLSYLSPYWIEQILARIDLRTVHLMTSYRVISGINSSASLTLTVHSRRFVVNSSQNSGSSGRVAVESVIV